MSDSSPDAVRRRLIKAALAGAAGTMLPWEMLQAQTNGSSLTIAYPTDVPSWDPALLTVPAAQPIYQAVFDSPLRMSQSLKLEARQITTWKWQDTNAQRLEITLRDGMTFHDGSPLTMDDLKYSLFDRPQANKKLAVGGLFNTVSNIEIISPTHGVIVYSKPTPAGPVFLGFLAAFILPKAYMQKVGDDGFVAKPVGAGPYRLVDYQRGGRVVLEAFDKFWAGPPPIKQVTFDLMPEAAARVAAVESGHAGVAVQLPIRETLRLGKVPGISSKIYPYSEVSMVRLPNYVKPFDDPNVRAAMHYAINTEALSKAFYGGVAVPVSVASIPGTPAFDSAYKFPYDPKKAIAALAKSGYSASNPCKIPLLSTNGAFAGDYDMARAIVGMWQQVGIVADLQETTTAAVLAQLQATKMPGALVYSWANSTGDPDNDTGRILDPRLRFSTWKDPALGPRVDAAQGETDPAKRNELYKALARDASENSWVIPLLQSVTTIAWRSNYEIKIFNSGYVEVADYKMKKA